MTFARKVSRVEQRLEQQASELIDTKQRVDLPFEQVPAMTLTIRRSPTALPTVERANQRVLTTPGYTPDEIAEPMSGYVLTTEGAEKTQV